MKINRLLIVSAVSVLIGGGGFVTSKALADQFLVAQNSWSNATQGKENAGVVESLNV